VGHGLRRFRKLADSSELKTGRSYRELAKAWGSLQRTHAIVATGVAHNGRTPPLLMVELQTHEAQPWISLAAGVHGDEPAAPWALLSVVRDGLLDAQFAYRIWCCTNPAGYSAGTRQNADGSDINRSFSRDGASATTVEARTIEQANRGRRFALSLDLHEDFEASGFYCYEPVVDGAAPLGARVVEAIDDTGLRVQEIGAGFDLGYPPEATHLRAIERGRVMPNVEAEVNHFNGLPYSMYLLRTGTAHRTMTLESPSARPWDERIAMHRTAVVTALSGLRAA
jgi:protein MpaA